MKGKDCYVHTHRHNHVPFDFVFLLKSLDFNPTMHKTLYIVFKPVEHEFACYVRWVNDVRDSAGTIKVAYQHILDLPTMIADICITIPHTTWQVNDPMYDYYGEILSQRVNVGTQKRNVPVSPISNDELKRAVETVPAEVIAWVRKQHACGSNVPVIKPTPKGMTKMQNWINNVTGNQYTQAQLKYIANALVHTRE